MSTQTKNKLLFLIIAVLLISNMALLYMLFSQQPGGEKKFRQSRQEFIAAYLKNELKFSEDQMKQYQSFSQQHMDEVKSLFDSMAMKRKKTLRRLAADDFSDSAIAMAAAQMNTDQSGIELKMIQHLKTIRLLCTAEQKATFDTGFYKIIGRRQGKNKTN